MESRRHGCHNFSDTASKSKPSEKPFAKDAPILTPSSRVSPMSIPSMAMTPTFKPSEEDYNKLADAINNADGAAANMSETMLDNLQGSITLLQSAVDGVKISFGERLSPYVRGLADWLTAQMLLSITAEKIEDKSGASPPGNSLPALESRLLNPCQPDAEKIQRDC